MPLFRCRRRFLLVDEEYIRFHHTMLRRARYMICAILLFFAIYFEFCLRFFL